MTSVPKVIQSADDFADIWQAEEESDEAYSAGLWRRRVLLGAGGLMLVLLVLSLVIPIGTAVFGTGEVISESRTKRVAHPQGGVIAEVLVANGQRVEEGDILLRLEDQVSGPAAAFSSMTVEQLTAQKARLEAERLGASSIAFGRELASAGTANAVRAMEDEQKLFRIRMAEQQQLRAQLQARIQQYREQIAGYEAQIQSLDRQKELIEPELEGVRELWEQELVTINRLNQLERTQAGLVGSIASLRADIARSNASISETREALIQLEQSRRAEAATELARLNTVLNEQRTRSVAVNDQQDNTQINAPYAGTVEKLAFTAAGDVIQPAEPILEIVPRGETMIVEAAISPTDVDRVRVGQSANLRFVAFNLATTPEIAGEVTYVASDRQEDKETGAAFYIVKISIDQEQLRRERLELRSGMPVEAVISTGSRTMMSFITKPLRDQLARAFRYN